MFKFLFVLKIITCELCKYRDGNMHYILDCRRCVLELSTCKTNKIFQVSPGYCLQLIISWLRSEPFIKLTATPGIINQRLEMRFKVPSPHSPILRARESPLLCGLEPTEGSAVSGDSLCLTGDCLAGMRRMIFVWRLDRDSGNCDWSSSCGEIATIHLRSGNIHTSTPSDH